MLNGFIMIEEFALFQLLFSNQELDSNNVGCVP